MYDIEIYEDKNGRSEAGEYIKGLQKKIEKAKRLLNDYKNRSEEKWVKNLKNGKILKKN